MRSGPATTATPALATTAGAGAPRRRNKSKEKGTAAETAVVKVLRANGFPHAERRTLKGIHDQGDITGCIGLCFEVKGGDAAKNASDNQITAWIAETETERINASADIGILVVQRRGVGPANADRWWAILRCNAWILGATKHDFPVRMHLADACTLLRRAGYGTPLDTEAVSA
ncbi:hypothetical protein [Microbispora rosea]|uniref:hypothetical protein n=1 Tax=Microbispora rosea TaxID=58117 RepID=UPI0037A9133F